MALDLETTGLSAYAGDEIVQIAMIEYEGLTPTGEELCSRIRPSIPIPASATAIHGTEDGMVADAPTIDELVDPMVEFFDNDVIVGHHIAFDLRFVNRVLKRELFCRLPNPAVDTMLMYLSRSGRLGHHEPVDVARSCRVRVTDRHDARGDALTTGRIFAHLARPAASAGHTVRELIAGTHAGAPDEPGTPPA